MAKSLGPGVLSHPSRASRCGTAIFRTFTAGLVVGLGYLGLAGGAFGPASPDLGDAGQAGPVAATAKIDRSGVDPVITGSVAGLFDNAIFSGPNRAEKTGRYRPATDAMAIAMSFEAARTRLAALRAPAPEPVVPAGDEGSRISVAAIHPNAAAALDAIAGIAPPMEPGIVLPTAVPETLAYARANTPAIGNMATGEAMEASARELNCLATAIYFEARGESYRGQVAVAQVVLNRVKDHRYPDTICGVVYQNQHRRNACQFSFACDGIPEVINEREPWAQAEDIASKVTKGELYLTEVGEATHYHATYVRPAWAPRMTKLTQIGLHVFYKFKSGWLFG